MRQIPRNRHDERPKSYREDGRVVRTRPTNVAHGHFAAILKCRTDFDRQFRARTASEGDIESAVAIIHDGVRLDCSELNVGLLAECDTQPRALLRRRIVGGALAPIRDDPVVDGNAGRCSADGGIDQCAIRIATPVHRSRDEIVLLSVLTEP